MNFLLTIFISSLLYVLFSMYMIRLLFLVMHVRQPPFAIIQPFSFLWSIQIYLPHVISNIKFVFNSAEWICCSVMGFFLFSNWHCFKSLEVKAVMLEQETVWCYRDFIFIEPRNSITFINLHLLLDSVPSLQHQRGVIAVYNGAPPFGRRELPAFLNLAEV